MRGGAACAVKRAGRPVCGDLARAARLNDRAKRGDSTYAAEQIEDVVRGEAARVGVTL